MWYMSSLKLSLIESFVLSVRVLIYKSAHWGEKYNLKVQIWTPFVQFLKRGVRADTRDFLKDFLNSMFSLYTYL